MLQIMHYIKIRAMSLLLGMVIATLILNLVNSSLSNVEVGAAILGISGLYLFIGSYIYDACLENKAKNQRLNTKPVTMSDTIVAIKTIRTIGPHCIAKVELDTGRVVRIDFPSSYADALIGATLDSINASVFRYNMNSPSDILNKYI